MLTLAVTAPPGPPADGAAFLDRLEPGWLEAAYAGDPSRLGAVTAARRNLGDVSLRYRTLLSRLGPGLDGPGTLADADAWYFILEGTREQSVAEAQAMALTELVAHAATSPRRRAAGDPAGLRRLLGRVRPGAAVAALRTRPVPRRRRPGLRAVLAGAGPRR